MVLPSITTQRKVVAILSAYDHLIENNRRRAAVLEEMARRVYEEWFINFRFPGHEEVVLVDTGLGPTPQGSMPADTWSCH
jgi:type I restriction enzyme S subunit